jgi:nucleoside-diphosphate-sugar epimerase
MMDSIIPENKVYNESDSGNSMIEVTKNMTRDHPLYPYRVFTAYFAAKKLATDAIWTFRANNRPRFAIATFHPASVIGRPVNFPSDPEMLSPSIIPIVAIWKGPSDGPLPPPLAQAAFVDVGDTAKAHLWAYENPEKADAQQYILSAGYGPPQARADIMREHFPDIGKRFIKGSPGAGYTSGKDSNNRVTKYWWDEGTSQVSGEKFVKEAGFTYKTLEQSVVESVEALETAYGSQSAN